MLFLPLIRIIHGSIGSSSPHFLSSDYLQLVFA